MTDSVQSIYKTAREFAGLTQERAATALHISVRSLAAYESGERIPADDVVVRMVDLYSYNQLAVQHLRQTSELARRVVPDLNERSVMEASIRLLNSMNKFARKHSLDRLTEIAEDNQITQDEREDFDVILNDLRQIIQAGMELSVHCEPRKEALTHDN